MNRLPCKPSRRATDNHGYPVVDNRRRWAPRAERGSVRREHRVVYERAHGPIPRGLQIDHLCHGWDEGCAGGSSCHHRRCIEVTHLEAVTPAENKARGRSRNAINARKTHCLRGHEFDESNTYRRPDTGERQCRECSRVRLQGYPSRPRKPGRPLGPDDSRHGTRSGYVHHRCRCQPCRAAESAYARRRSEARRAAA